VLQYEQKYLLLDEVVPEEGFTTTT